ncbi:sequestosome-1-like [Morone saxatilis]|uniref:sequestosome-1-like n=1 Tax=Morone saxatilis TaxID=34816 RepID=UPI0015E233A9|nr:sequestosome-1-like [Morone saxatilis]
MLFHTVFKVTIIDSRSTHSIQSQEAWREKSRLLANQSRGGWLQMKAGREESFSLRLCEVGTGTRSRMLEPVPVKVHLLGIDDSVMEVRRFELSPAYYHRNIKYVNTTITELFNLKRTFKLFYKDEDGDMVAFSSDNELRTALNCIKDNTFRVFIKRTFW